MTPPSTLDSAICTCGEKNVNPRTHYDISGYCETSWHDGCRGDLSGATGYHWWCICSCHPTPDVTEEDEGEMLAFATWKRAKAR